MCVVLSRLLLVVVVVDNNVLHVALAVCGSAVVFVVF